jgi:hypothetical protein
VIQSPPPMAMAECVEPERTPYLEPMRCSRCGNTIALVSLVVGAVVQIRCHHKFRGKDGKEVKCGWINRVQPTR